MAVADTLTTRQALRTAVLEDIVGRCELAAIAIEGGPLDGVQVVSMGTLRDQVTGAMLVDLPPPSDQYAEVTTPAKVTVSAVCPECRLPAEIVVALTPQLTVTDDGAELAVKAKTKARVHVCGQLSLPAVDDDQQDFGLSDIVGELPEDQAILEALALVQDQIPAELGPLTVESIAPWSDLDKRRAYEWAVLTHEAEADETVVVPALPFILGGEEDDDDEADGGVAAEPDPDAPAGEPGALECVGSNHVPGCEHMAGEVPKKGGAS